MPDESKSVPLAKSKAATGIEGPVAGNLLEGNQQAFARWLEGMCALAQEITRFTQLRLQEDMAAWSTLAACSSPEQAVDCQRRFAAKAAEQYAEEMAKLSRMMIGIAGEGVSSLQAQAAAKTRRQVDEIAAR